jgi:hypothetical protein
VKNGKLAVPTKLKNGYLLDNRGISANTAFINMTYLTYSELEKVPSLAELYELIVDKDPLLGLYNCGKHIKDVNLIKQINNNIMNNNLGVYELIK